MDGYTSKITNRDGYRVSFGPGALDAGSLAPASRAFSREITENPYLGQRLRLPSVCGVRIRTEALRIVTSQVP
jgi:hypothetical protein